MKKTLCALLLAIWLPFQAPPDTRKLAADLEQSVVKIVVLKDNQANSIGTGFFVGKGNLIASASHVYLEAGRAIVDGAGGKICAIKIMRSGERFLVPVELAAKDYEHDVVLLKFDPTLVKKQVANFEIKPLELSDEKESIGNEVAFMGYFGSDELPLFLRTTIAGFASAPLPGQAILGVSANAGQSGSPVVSLGDGRVVGVLVAFVPVILAPGALPTHSGLSRAVDVVHLKELMESADVR